MQQRLMIFFFIFLLFSCSKKDKSPIDYVDPLIGTGFHGHTFPGATTPFGAVQLSPDTRFGNWDACSGYHYSDSAIIGFSHTHLSGTGVADLGDILFHPTTKEFKPTSDGYIFDYLLFSHKDEMASPGYYSVNFKQEGINAELTATAHTGMHRYTFEKAKEVNLIIDMHHLLAEESIDSLEIMQTGENKISGMRRTQGWTPNQYVFFVARFSKKFTSVQHINNGKVLKESDAPTSSNQQFFIKFGKSDGTPLVVQVGLSAVSRENALLNLEAENGKFNFDSVQHQAKQKWVEALSQITVKGGSEDDKKNFYTAIYHTKLMPNLMSDSNGEYRRHNMKTGQLPIGKNYYSAFSIWDTFRAWNPLQTIVDTSLVNQMINSLLLMYDDTGELPIWPLSAGETGTMIGYHAVSIIADAYLKGIRGFDTEKALQAMKVSSDINKKGSDYYTRLGYIPSNIKRESVSCVLEYAYDDWCISQMAKEMGRLADFEKYRQRALSYINVFDGFSKFFRGKRLDGNWDNPFNPFEPGRAYTEATAWQYRFFVPHDVNGMEQLFGGRDEFVKQLDSLFIVTSDVQGEMVDITGLIGQYAHGNEPSHHMAYLYNYVGQPWKTQELTRRILKELYHPTPEGISGNEDCGQMSAWYILSSLGIYEVCPGSNQFVLTTPLFEKINIKLANGKTLVIKANNPKDNIYIDKVVLNGRDLNANFITYDQIMGGGELSFSLSSSPNKQRGTQEDALPYSLTIGQKVSIPYNHGDLNLFVGEAEVTLGTATSGAAIYYSLDGKDPDTTSILYQAPFKIQNSYLIKAKAFKKGCQPSPIFSIQASKANMEKGETNPKTENGTNFKYYEGNFSSVSQIEKSVVKASGTIAAPTIKEAMQPDHFGYIFTGFIYIPQDDVYEFMTKSDDGSVLYINNTKVVDNDGSHAAITATGRIALKKGFHPYKLMYFEDYEGDELSWAWKRVADKQYAPIPKENLFVR